MDSPISLAMTACPRLDVLLPTAVQMLRRGGFKETLHIFAEPGTDFRALRGYPDIVVHENPRRFGGPLNYRQALEYLLTQTQTPYFMIVEDDVCYCNGARARLLDGIATHPKATLFNLYLPNRYQDAYKDPEPGWFIHNRGSGTFGMLAICYRREGGILKFVNDPGVKRDFLTKPRLSYDSRMFGYFATKQDKGCYGHYPSLTDHYGPISMQGHKDGPNRRGWDFNPTAW